MKDKILVTGGAGYVGSVLVPKLLKDFDVRVLDAMYFGDQGLKDVKERCEIVKGDIRDIGCLEKSLVGINHVIHLAAISNDPCGDLNPELTQQTNYDATKNLLEISKKNRIERFIYASTSSVYGIKAESSVTEDLSLEPLTIYSKTKAEAEKLILSESSSDFVTTAVRSATVCGYSPRQRLDVIVNILTSRAVNNGEVIINGGHQKRPNVHIDDITDLYIELVSSPKEKISGQVFNYGGKNHTVEELAIIVKGVIGEHVKVIKKPLTKDSRSYSISSKKIKEALGASPKKTIEEAVMDLRDAFEQGKIPNPSSSIYRNVVRMQELNLL